MITIEVPRRVDDPKTIDIERTHPAMLTAVRETMQAYPTVTNETGNKDFDRLFENLYNCSIKYDQDNFNAVSITWPEDRDYTVFLLRWS